MQLGGGIILEGHGQVDLALHRADDALHARGPPGGEQIVGVGPATGTQPDPPSHSDRRTADPYRAQRLLADAQQVTHLGGDAGLGFRLQVDGPHCTDRPVQALPHRRRQPVGAIDERGGPGVGRPPT